MEPSVRESVPGSEDASGQGADLRTESAVHRHGATESPGAP